MAAGAFTPPRAFRLYMADGTFDLDAETNLKVAFLTNGYSAFDEEAHYLWSHFSAYDIGATGTYPAGGVALTSVTWARDTNSKLVKLKAADVSFSIGATPKTCKYMVIYKAATVGGVVSPVVGVCLMDSTGGDVTIPANGVVNLGLAASGFLVST